MKNSNYFGKNIKHSPLHLCETVEEAKYYLDRGFKPDESFEIITSPIHLANSLEILHLYLERGCDPNAGQNENKSTPLFTHRNIDNLRLLISYGANPNIKDGWGQTPLFTCEKLENVQLLLDHGADPDIVDDEGMLVDEWWTDEYEGKAMKAAVRKARERKSRALAQT